MSSWMLLQAVYYQWLQPKERHHPGEAYEALQGDEPCDILHDNTATSSNGHGQQQQQASGAVVQQQQQAAADRVSFKEGLWR